MIIEKYSTRRTVKQESLSADLAIVGGGLSGTCCAITAARAGLKVVLIQDRPVLGGNSSSEVRLWILGATSHMGNNNRWAREGGVIDEILVENTYRNPEGNTLILDTILLEKVVEEQNIILLLNTSMYEVDKKDDDSIKSVKAFCSQNSTEYQVSAPYFCDASGDGILAFQAGASFRMGAESKEEFDEPFAPDADYGHLLGHTIYFYSKDVGKPVKYVPPSFALTDIKEIPRYRNLDIKSQGCQLWWLEYGGRLDTIHQSEEIKWELWKVVYGIWHHIKNSGEFPDAKTKTLEWVGTIPGKRESRRFEGDYMTSQKDIVQQNTFEDAVAFGGWAIDLHPADGVYSDKPGCNQWHSKGVYQIPLRMLYSKDISNLFLAGRIVSATHVAFGSTRVMATCAHLGQAVGMAAVVAKEQGMKPAELVKDADVLKHLQQRLNETGQSIPHIPLSQEKNLANSAEIIASSTFELNELPANGNWLHLNQGAGQMIPITMGEKLQVELTVKATASTELTVELHRSAKHGNHTPDELILDKKIALVQGEQQVELDFGVPTDKSEYLFLIFRTNEAVYLQQSDLRLTGVLSVFNKANKAVSNSGRQDPPAHIGVDSFEFWTPERRPKGQNIAMKFIEPVKLYSTEQLTNGYVRPTTATNAWAASVEDEKPSLTFVWDSPQAISEIKLFFDTDYDHPMESSLMGHPEATMPFVVNHYQVFDDKDELVYEQKDNHQTINQIKWEEPVRSQSLKIVFDNTGREVPVSVFEVHIKGD